MANTSPLTNWVSALAALVAAAGTIFVGIVGAGVSRDIAQAESELRASVAEAEIALGQSQLDEDYVRIAVDILATPKPDTDSESTLEADAALRTWAVEVLGSHSPVPISDSLKAALQQGDALLGQSDPLTLAGIISGDGLFSDIFRGMSGQLPEGCTLSLALETPLFAEPGGERTGSVAAGRYEAFEVRVIGLGSFYRIEDGWVKHDAYFTTLGSECSPEETLTSP